MNPKGLLLWVPKHRKNKSNSNIFSHCFLTLSNYIILFAFRIFTCGSYSLFISLIFKKFRIILQEVAKLVQGLLYKLHPLSFIGVTLFHHDPFVTSYKKPTLVYYYQLNSTLYSNFTSFLLHNFFLSQDLIHTTILHLAIMSS